MKKLIEEFLTNLELKGYKTDRDGEIFGIYFVELKDNFIKLEEKSFPNFKIEKYSLSYGKEIVELRRDLLNLKVEKELEESEEFNIEDFRKDLLNFKVEKELEEFDIENLRKYEKISNENVSGE